MECPLSVLVVEPRLAAQFYRGANAAQPLSGLEDQIAALARGKEPARILEQHRAQLAAGAKGLKPGQEHVPDGVAQVGGKVPGVETRPGSEFRGQFVADVFWQPLRFGRLAGHERVGLGVEDEVRRSARHPGLGYARTRQRVVSSIDLHDRERFRVVGEALLRGIGASRVEDARRRHRRVRP